MNTPKHLQTAVLQLLCAPVMGAGGGRRIQEREKEKRNSRIQTSYTWTKCLFWGVRAAGRPTDPDIATEGCCLPEMLVTGAILLVGGQTRARQGAEEAGTGK